MKPQPNPSPLAHRIELSIAIASLILGVIGLMLAIRTEPSVSTEPPLDPNKVLTTPFVIRNEGPLTIRDVSVAIMMRNFRDTNNNRIGTGTMGWSKTPVSEEMRRGIPKTIPGPFERIADDASQVIAGDYFVLVSFRPLLGISLWERKRAFRFTIALQSDGKSRFEQQPAPESIIEEYESTQRGYE
jgi:hypothetical protein